ncbi:T9SS type A sorting domain-containing protein [Neolewinella antarctica]|uniref:Secretion system C-terminal sorting domain-containing protein n=1 Tax=Neolewinella antarctica TaxID=442734 RepID=A0ABX0XC66_9BACT|nr:T9SS type A sorting domain-containing protein [Neolewinella antarctica]NJC26675.1 hypothetical protein [Neolewinella antarctica]
MRTAITLFLTLFSLFCHAQDIDLLIEPANVTKEVTVDDLDKRYQDITNVTVTNRSNRTIDLVQEQVDGTMPTNWTYGTFSRRTETAPFIVPRNKVQEAAPVRLGPGEMATFSVVLSSGGSTGTGTVGVIFTDANLPGVILGTGNFTTRIVRRANAASTENGRPAARRPNPTSVALYPNPARERFFVESPAGTNLGRVDVANTLGKRLLSFPKPSGKEGYDIEKLPDGLYLISIYDDRGKKLKTLRLLHRRFGA